MSNCAVILFRLGLHDVARGGSAVADQPQNRFSSTSTNLRQQLIMTVCQFIYRHSFPFPKVASGSIYLSDVQARALTWRSSWEIRAESLHLTAHMQKPSRSGIACSDQLPLQ